MQTLKEDFENCDAKSNIANWAK